MELYIFLLIILAILTIINLTVGVSNDAVNFLQSSIGARVAPRYIIMTVASLGILVGVTFSSGMMEVARKGIFHPKLFLMPDLMTMFLAVMIANVIILDLFNTFGLPTSTTVSIVFGLLGAAVAVSLMKIHISSESYIALVEYINSGKALAIILGIILSVVFAFFFGVVAQFVTRIIFTFDYTKRLKRYSGVWGGIALSIITYFILIKGAKGTSFLTPETITWVNGHTWTILFINFLFFAVIFQLLTLFTRIDILKPIVLIGTFALAMAFAANDLVNFIGVPLAGLSAYRVAAVATDPLATTMEALQKPIQSNTLLLLLAGGIMMATLWISRKSRTVTSTGVDLSRQDEGFERFGSSALSRIVIGLGYNVFEFSRKITPLSIRRFIAIRLDPSNHKSFPVADGKTASFDLIRASVNLIVASAVISFATSLKLPLSTTYVTFMVAMGTSLADQAWGRESAVYRITGVMIVIGGWFFTAFAAFSVTFIFALLISIFKLAAIICLLILAFVLVLNTFRYHSKKEKEITEIKTFALKSVNNADTAVMTSFELSSQFLKAISDNIVISFEAAISEDRERLKSSKNKVYQIQNWSNITIENIFDTLFLLQKTDLQDARRYSSAIDSVRAIAESHRDIVTRMSDHFQNYHIGFLDDQKKELRLLKTLLSRLLWNTSIMLSRRKKVDYNYIYSQCEKIENLIKECKTCQVKRIQERKSKTRLSIMFYGLLGNCVRISERTKELLNIFRESFDTK